jgi:hypothetical protein
MQGAPQSDVAGAVAASWRRPALAGHTSAVAKPVSRGLPSCREWPQPEPIDPAQDLGEQGARHRHLNDRFEVTTSQSTPTRARSALQPYFGRAQARV